VCGKLKFTEDEHAPQSQSPQWIGVLLGVGEGMRADADRILRPAAYLLLEEMPI